MWVIQICDALEGPPPAMIQGMMKELKLATASSRIVTVETLLKWGNVTCQKRCHALAPSTLAARSNCSGTVCRPAVIMIMANGNSRQILTTIREGSTVLTLSMKFGGRAVHP